MKHKSYRHCEKQEQIKKLFFHAGILFLMILAYEWILRTDTVGKLQGGAPLQSFLILLVMSAFFALLLAAVSGLFSRRAERNILTTVIITLAVVYASQVVYYDIFRTFYTTYSMFNGGQVAEFQGIIWQTILEKCLPLLLIALACTAAVIAVRRKRFLLHGLNWRAICLTIPTLLLCLGLMQVLVFTGERGIGSAYSYYTQTNEIKGAVKSFGLLTADALDAGRLAARKIDQAVSNEADEQALEELDAWFADRQPQQTNEKTGMFKGKNLILITAESFTDFAVSQTYTPTLYRLQKEGFSFSNYYNPVWGVSTSDGEYLNLVGLLPEAGVWSMTESAQNALPFTLAHQFAEQGYQTKAYHDHSIEFYHRTKTHPNLGYDFDGQGGSYEFTHTWPESDLEMVDQTTADFLTPDAEGNIQPFHVYYLTVSGHMEYNFWDQQMSIKHQAEVADMPVSETCKAYMAANMELDQAVELLIQRLDEAGVLQDTVIAIAGDHYPYALKDEQIAELKRYVTGRGLDNAYEKFRSSLIIWTPGMQAETVEKVGSNLDILPTLINLFGLDQTAGRYLMGRDLFDTEQEGLAVFEDQTWITDRGRREVLAAEEDPKTQDYVRQTDETVMQMFRYSKMILDEDYYRHLAEDDLHTSNIKS